MIKSIQIKNNRNIFRKTVLLILLSAFVNFTSGTYLGIYNIPEAEAGVFKVTILTTADTSWTVPNDWPAVGNMVEVIGGGGGAGDGSNEGTGGAGGGAYARSINLRLVRGTVMNVATDFNVGSGGAGAATNNGSGTNGGDSWFNASSLANCVTLTSAVCAGAEGGKLSAGNDITVGAGGLAANSIGILTFDGGSGGAGDSGTPDAGGGGGGAGGPYGAGNDGIAGTSTGAGGSGGAGFGGAGGSGGTTNGNPGNDGIEWRIISGSLVGSGGGGEGGENGGAGGAGGSYGAGAGGGEVQDGTNDGAPGLIVITYVPTGHVVRGGVKIRGKVTFR